MLSPVSWNCLGEVRQIGERFVMRGSANMAEMPDVRCRQAFFGREIMRRNQTLERELKFTSNFSLLEMHTIRGPFSDMAFERIFSLPLRSFSPVAAFCGPNSNNRNEACFATSRQACKIIAPEAHHSHAAFLTIWPDASWINEWRLSCVNAPSEGDGCMKDTDHPISHPLRHPRIFGRVRNRISCVRHDDQFGRGQNTGLGWSDPTVVHVSVPKVIRGVAPAQLRGDRAEYFVRVQMGRRTTSKTVWNYPNS
jgi:hypothetical protein